METVRLSNRQHAVIAIILFLLTLLIYWHSRNTFLSDTLWAVHISSSIINSGNIDLDEYEQVVQERNFYGTIDRRENDGHIQPYFPVGNSIMAIPIVWVIENIKEFPGQQSFYEYMQQTSSRDSTLVSIQHFVASLITALIVPLLYYIGCKQFNVIVALLGTLVFAFGTSAYSTASRVLWQHGPSMLMLTIAMALFIKAERDPGAIRWVGIPLAFSYVIRPTNSISILILTGVVLLRYRKQFPAYILGAMIIAVPFISSSLNNYNSILPPYYNPKRVGGSPYFLEALIGNLISPARGLFIFSPVLMFAIYGGFSRLWHKRFTLIDGAFAIIIVLHWIMISTFGHWWGGHSYGPRFFTDVLPFMIYFLFMGLYELGRVIIRPHLRQIGMSLFAFLAFISIYIHYIGANQPAIFSWIQWPMSIDQYPEIRLWDWRDLIFFRTVEDWPFSDLTSSISFDLQEFQIDDLLHIPLHNMAEDEYLWEVKLPSSLTIVKIDGIEYGYAESGIPIVVGEAALPTRGYQWLPIAVEAPLSSFTDPSLGAIMVTAKTVQGEERSVQVIPVSIVNNGRSWQESDALSDRVWLPGDIRVNNDKADNMLYGLYGSGWYGLESFKQYQWRWAQSPAELYLFSATPRSLTLELTFSSLHDMAQEDGLGEIGRMRISVNGDDRVESIKVDELHQIPVSLDAGWNILLFYLEAGNFRPAEVDASSSDRRLLSFSLDSINLVSTD